DLGAVQAERPGAFREVTVVADVHADLADGRLEHGVTEVAGPEVELLPEALHVGDVRLAILGEIASVGVDDRRGVVVDPRRLLMLLDHRFLVAGPAGLKKRPSDDARHVDPHSILVPQKRGKERGYTGAHSPVDHAAAARRALSKLPTAVATALRPRRRRAGLP